jgi:hypothetical protein
MEVVLDKNTLKGILLAVVGAASFVLALFGMPLSGKIGFPTLGVLVMAWLAPRSRAISLGGAIVLQVAIDFVFWFALTCAFLWAVGRQRQKRSASQPQRFS